MLPLDAAGDETRFGAVVVAGLTGVVAAEAVAAFGRSPVPTTAPVPVE